jgi:hypothetical protein
MLHRILVLNSSSSSISDQQRLVITTATAAIPRHLRQQVACHPFGSLQHLQQAKPLQQNVQHPSAL